MKVKLLLLLSVALLFGCGSKRTITDYQKHEARITTNVTASVVDSTKTTQKDSSITRSNIKDDYEISTKEVTVFDSLGRKVSTTKETNRKGTKIKIKEKSMGSENGSTNVKKVGLDLTTDSATIDQDFHGEEIPEKPKNPIWNWIGGALFVIIVGGAIMLWLKLK